MLGWRRKSFAGFPTRQAIYETDCDIIKETVVIKYYSAIRSQIKIWNCDTEHILVSLMLLL